MDKQEKIVCAAVKITYKDGIGDYAIDVICNATYKLIRQGQSYKRQHFVHASTAKDTDGFITNYGRFVDAKEAMRIAISQCQIYSVELLYRELNTHNASPRYDNWQLHHDQIKTGIALMESSLLARELKPEDLY